MTLDEALAVKAYFGSIYPTVLQRELLKNADLVIHRYATKALDDFARQNPELSAKGVGLVIDAASGRLEVDR